MKLHKIFWNAGDQKGHLRIMWPQKPVAMHIHDFDELVFVLSGSAIHVVGKEKYPLIQGDVFVIKAEQPHTFEKMNQLCLVNLLYKWDENYIHLEKEYSAIPALKALFIHEPQYRKQKSFKAKLHLAPWQLNEMVRLLDIMKKEESNKRIGYNSILENTFKTILIKICRYYAETNLPGPRKMLKMGAVIDYLNDHYHEPVTRDELVNIADMSCASFCRIFKDTTGLSPMNYLIRLRIEKAAELLAENKEIRIIDVATKTGFENSAYFSRKFKEILGVAPKEYHKKQHKVVDLDGSDELKE